MRRFSGIVVLIASIVAASNLFGRSIDVSLPDTSAYNGDLINIPVMISDLQLSDSVISYQFTVHFNPEVLTPNGATSAGAITSGWGSPLVNLQIPGEVTVGSYGANILTGKGILVFLKFTVKGAVTDTTNLHFTRFYFNDGDPGATLHSAVFTVLGQMATLSFRTNIEDSVKMIFAGRDHTFPFDTVVVAETQYTIDVTSPQSFALGTRYMFDNWSDGGAKQHTITADDDKIITLNMKTEYALTIATEPADLVEIDGADWYPEQTTTSITAPLSATMEGIYYGFSHWMLDEESFANNSISVVMDARHDLVAVYEPAYTISGRIRFNGNGLVDALVILSGDKSDTLTTDKNGAYIFENIPGGNYTITPLRSGFGFEPTSRNYQPLTADHNSDDFVSTDTLAPQLKVLSPNGGEEIRVSTPDTIKWEVSDNDTVTFINIHYSTNNGKEWHLIYGGTSSINSFAWLTPSQPYDNVRVKITVSDKSGNVQSDESDDFFKIIYETSIAGKEAAVPEKCYLYQNYPNPFNNSTRLTYRIARQGDVRLDIYNMQGQLIRSLVNQQQTPGEFNVIWDGKNLQNHVVSSGQYLIRLRAPDYMATKHIVFMK
ncbi:T9SS type A sorting domain-containing protein [candidate division KSB1 bacterium]|nr:T9SS type A sorting domain-containing protein [candidate division KSB1 bacterium]